MVMGPNTAPALESTLGIRLDLRLMIIDKVADPVYEKRRSLIGWCHTHDQPYPVWMDGAPIGELHFPYGERDQLLCRLNTKWRDGQDPGEYDPRYWTLGWGIKAR